jgi:hypothetical protein
MPANQTAQNVAIMKKAASKRPNRPVKRVTPRSAKATESDEMRSHYDFDYAKARSNRFAERFTQETVAVVLDPDVAHVFHSSDSVNAFLRSAITAMPQAATPKKKRSASAYNRRITSRSS